MSDIIEIIRGRRSIRSYDKNRDLEEDDIDLILEAIRWSPSWANTQCWEVIIVKDPQIKEALQQTLPKSNPAYNSITDAPVVFVLCAQLKKSGYYKGSAATKFGDWFMFDLGIAAHALCLAAHAQGLGTVIVGLFDHDRARETLKVPDEYEVAALIPVGYPKKIPSPPKRREIKEFTHFDSF